LNCWSQERRTRAASSKATWCRIRRRRVPGFAPSGKQQLVVFTEQQRPTVFDKVITLVDTKVMGPDVDVKRLREVRRPRVPGSSTQEDFEQALDALLRDLKTSHAGFFHVSSTLRCSNRDGRDVHEDEYG
jgi:hypothetical protein